MNWNFEILKKNSLIYSWFIYKIFIYFLYKVLGLGVKNIKVVSGFDLEINIVSKNIYPIILFFKKHSLSQCKSIMDIICYDNFGKKFRFSIIYNLLSVFYNIRIRILSKIKEFAQLLSLVGLFKSINWFEREIFDFFGIFFIWNNDLRRILTDYGFKGFPLRKDFPVVGFIEVFYDDNQKRICYKKLELAQEYKNFRLQNLWNFK